MLTSLALLFLVGLGLAAVFERLKLPRILGMLLAGVLLGPVRSMCWMRRCWESQRSCGKWH